MTDCCVPARWPDLGAIHGSHVAKTWRSPIEKAAGDGTNHEWLLAIADRLLPKVRAAFLAAVERLRGSADEVALRRALEAGDVDAAMAALNIDAGLSQALSAELTQPLEDAFIDAGRAAPGQTLAGGEMAMRFDLVNPGVAEFLEGYDLKLIREITDETREAVRRVVSNAVQFGGHPVRDQAKEIRQFIGLTQRQTQAVMNYRDALVEERRAPDQVERMAEKYRQRMLRLRAETIARTETMRASNAGQQQAWRQAAGQGLIDTALARRFWLITPDDRLCKWCREVPGMNKAGVALDGLFQTPLGPVAYPPLHPQCRCTVTLRQRG